MNVGDHDAVPVQKHVHLVNMFVLDTQAFLNKFSLVVEEKLRGVHSGIGRIEKELAVLEAKLALVPGIEDDGAEAGAVGGAAEGGSADSGAGTAAPATTTAAPPASTPAAAASAPALSAEAPGGAGAGPAAPEGGAEGAAEGGGGEAEAPAAPAVLTVKEDPAFRPFFKMLAVGVPPGGVKQKMIIAGLNPDLLDTPTAPSPNAGGLVATEE